MRPRQISLSSEDHGNHNSGRPWTKQVRLAEIVRPSDRRKISWAASCEFKGILHKQGI